MNIMETWNLPKDHKGMLMNLGETIIETSPATLISEAFLFAA
jgi:hypothetical protein